MKWKDKMYFFFAQKHEGIDMEYGTYVRSHMEEHKRHHLKHMWMLVRLNIHYRILGKKELLYSALYNKYNEAEKKSINDSIALKNKKRKDSGERNKGPCLNGSESSQNRPVLPVHFARSAMKYEIVSFDVFDTLIFRPFANPIDLFYIVGERLNLPEFKAIRTEAEKKLKEIHHIVGGSWEVTLEEIYDYIEKNYGINAGIGLQTEIEAEMDYCVANPYMKQVYKMVKEQNKRIIIVSDMYLRKEVIELLLSKNGYNGYEKLYVSNEYGCGKGREGDLYRYVINDYDKNQIVHIGDNQVSDVENAKKFGIDTLHYQNVNNVGNLYRTTDMSSLILSAYAGIVNMHLHNGTQQYSPAYEYGYICGGIYVLGFCNWMRKKAKEEKIEKILFLSRDGVIYKNVFDNLFSDIDNDYFLWSRIANIKYSFAEKGILAFATALDSILKSEDTYTVADFLDEYGLYELCDCLSLYGINKKTIMMESTLYKVRKLIVEQKNRIDSIYKKQMESLKNILTKKIGNCQRIAIVDVGWLGSGPLTLKKLIEDYFMFDCEVKCWVAGVRSTPKANIEPKVLSGEIEPYIFADCMNRDLFIAFTKKNIVPKYGLNYVFMEMFTQACCPSFTGISDEGKYEFKSPEVENYKLITEIHSGIMDFCASYYKTFMKDPYMLNISGSDVYRPFRLFTDNKSIFKNNFSEFSFPRVIGKGKLEQMERLSDFF